MRFEYFVAIANVFNSAFSQSNVTKDFEIITTPAKGDIVEAGSTYTIKWNHDPDYSGHVNILLEKGESPDSLETMGGIGGNHYLRPLYFDSLEHISDCTSGNVATDQMKYVWDLSHDIEPADNYYIKIVYLKDKSVYNYSPQFKIKNPNDPLSSTTNARETGTATSPTTTTSSGQTSTLTPSIIASKSTAGVSVITQAPLALVGAAAIGMLAF